MIDRFLDMIDRLLKTILVKITICLILLKNHLIKYLVSILTVVGVSRMSKRHVYDNHMLFTITICLILLKSHLIKIQYRS
jgi:hypothetical protein